MPKTRKLGGSSRALTRACIRLGGVGLYQNQLVRSFWGKPAACGESRDAPDTCPTSLVFAGSPVVTLTRI